MLLLFGKGEENKMIGRREIHLCYHEEACGRNAY